MVTDGLLNFVNNDLQSIQYLQMEPLFNMIIVGMTACVKTRYLLEMLETEYLGVFDYIVPIYPTFSWNKTHTEWPPSKENFCFLSIECDQDQVDR